MQLTKLEISGFKSFAKKTELIFKNGITGILGPNGCGKSNIADAFRFVLGEQNARALRGKRIDDFIFGGTEKRKPLSYCEVSMYFDNSDGLLASPFSEVVVTRRAFRSGESEYSINKTPARLRDIRELFRDTGIGKDGYSIIGQGRVSEILSDRSDDRREVFEEAAGVMKYRARKEEAERKLQATAKNILRLEDILRELESRLEPLRLQSEKAAEYFRLREELRELEINLFLYQYDKSNERLQQLRGVARQLSDEIPAALAEEEAYAAGCAKEEELERSLSAAISETSRTLIELSASVEGHAGNEKLIHERIDALTADIARRQAEITRIRERETADGERSSQLAEEINLKKASEDALEAALETAEAEFAELSGSINAAEEKLEAQKQSMMDYMNRLADTKSRISRLGAMRESIRKQTASLAQELIEAEAEGKHLDEEYAEARADKEALLKHKAEFETARQAAIDEVNALNVNALSAAKAIRRAEDEISAGKSRLKVLEEMRRAHEGYYASVRRLLNDAQRSAELKKRMHGVVAELLSVPQEYERAVESALGSALQNIVVPTEHDAKYLINYLREHDYGRATLLPVSAMRARLLTDEEKNCFRGIDGCFGIASELVRFSPEYGSVFENLLGRTVIVRDIDTGILISRRAKSAFRIATLKGDILNPGGSMTGGSLQKREFSLLGREREIEELAESRKTAESRLAELRNAEAECSKALQEANAKAAADADELRKLDVRFASLTEKADIVQKYIQKNVERIKQIAEEQQRLADAETDIDAECASAEAAANGIDLGSSANGQDIKNTQLELANLRSALQAANDEISALRIRHTAANRERISAENELKRLNAELADAETRRNAETIAIEAAERDCRQLNDELGSVSCGLSESRAELNALNEELRRLESERAARLNALDELRSKHEQVSLRSSELRERLHRNELATNKAQSELDNMNERIWRDYELTYDNALSFRREIAVTQAHLRTDELRKELKSLGDVNTSAIEDYRELNERFQSLTAQCGDLRQAEADLNELIAKLTETMEKEFCEQFSLIRQNFTATFSELFNGGHAELVLSDKSDVLNCNIDIIAQPPGKKLQLLSLLSGGEQALTAIALLFAILKLKPAAFCILDEIDTSLDEANVDCFAEYLRKYSEGTQFIIITHRKGAMAVCNSLYGVSMEEKGVSTLVSARLD